MPKPYFGFDAEQRDLASFCSLGIVVEVGNGGDLYPSNSSVPSLSTFLNAFTFLTQL